MVRRSWWFLLLIDITAWSGLAHVQAQTLDHSSPNSSLHASASPQPDSSHSNLALKDTSSSLSPKAIPTESRTAKIGVDTLTAASPDSADEGDETVIAVRLESARQHYLSALQAQAAGDSVLSSSEFEEAISILNEISYFPDIENNQEYNDLSRSVVEDYEKYIASIDDVGPQSSIFALREKLNLEVENIDISSVKIPNVPIPPTTIPMEMNDLVEKNIMFFIDKGRDHFERWLYLSGKYFPIIGKIFTEEGVPKEMMYLAMMESGLNPSARSWAKAVGMWQFMKGTGALYGLRGNYWYDERRDYEKASRAAARYLKDLHDEYNDWHLAIAAYNSGGGRINRGIRRSHGGDYWSMRRYLPRETRNYVPQYIAVSLMAMNPDAYGFKGVPRADSLTYEYVTVDDCVDLDVLADCAGTTAETLRELNPELIQWCTPPNYHGYKLRIPVGAAEAFQKKYAQIPDDQKRQWAEHKIRRGDTPGAIARRYGIATSVLLEVNKLNRHSRLRIGNYLIIPVSKKRLLAANSQPAAQQESEPVQKPKVVAHRFHRRQTVVPAGRDKIAYVVKKKDTLGHIAEWFDVRASDLRNWNNIPYGRSIQIGQTINVWVPTEKLAQYTKVLALSFEEKNALKAQPQAQLQATAAVHEQVDEQNHWVQHVVKRGETLEKIAGDYNVAIADLKSWNKLRRNRIYAGQALEVYVEPSARESVSPSNSPKQAPAKAIVFKQKTIRHKVRRGETLEKIAGMYNVSIADIKKWNRLTSSRVYSGKRLKIRLTSENIDYYRVRTGDTLWDISKKFGVSVNDIQRWNPLADNIKVGDKLVIYH
ncbi:MAG TPA: LysM peptidoglycan-binding domain-containing protein [Bacteroidota bacterium]|nr:LysM peptidoglycan-binding domain-containing protein [Bacteroidota bacterium]